MTIKTYKKQSYSSIKKQCLSQGILFEDPEFPASVKSLYHSKVENDIEWKRPKELCKVPKLVVAGVSSDDLVCDDVSKSWFAASCMALAREPKLWNKVVPDSAKQEWDEKNQYAGVFKFHVWRFGEWIEVIVDDRLPTRDGKLVFCHSSSKNEFWSALLEKAYAKLFGDYESMALGHVRDAMEDFTAGVPEKISFGSLAYSDPAKKSSVFGKMKEAHENKALMSCVIEVDPTLVGTSGPNGLINGLDYNVTMVKEIEVKTNLRAKLGTSNLRLVRLFTTGSGSRWTGAWSVGSTEMNQLTILDWEKMGLKYDKEEEFWMSYTDFSNIFTDVIICHFLNTSFFSLKKQWHETVLFSEWSQRGYSGGNKWEGNDSMVLANPQFMFDITNDKGSVIVSLEQRDMTADGMSNAARFNSIGFYIMKVEQNRKYRAHLKGDKKYGSDFVTSRSVFGRVDLEKGRYVVIPCCANRNALGQFMIRVYTGSNSNCVELTKECPTTGCCGPKYKMVTTIEVTKADGLALPPNEKGSLNPYIQILCEGEKVTSPFQKNTASPAFNTKATFYRKKPTEPIRVEVFNHGRLINTFLSEARIDLPDSQGGEEGIFKVFDVYGKKKEAEIKKPGQLHVFLRSSNDLSIL